jgi:hypothetical protein
MKTKTIFLFIMVLLGISSITKAQVVPQNQFVYWEGDEFKLEGEPFVMKGINYMMDFSYKIPSGTTDPVFYYGPYRQYASTYPTTQSEMIRLINAHFKMIKDMGFNTVRLMMHNIGYVDFTYGTTEYSGLYIRAWDVEQHHLTGYNISETNFAGDCSQWDDFFSLDDLLPLVIDATQTILTIAEYYDLKVIWVCGAGDLENVVADYCDYLAIISQQFEHNPNLMAYDFWHEPKGYTATDIDPNNSAQLKYRIAEITNQMNSTIKTYDRNHFTTIGTDGIWAIYDYGFKALNADFINPHPYDQWAYYYGLPDYATEDILKRDIYWFDTYMQGKRYFIGETGLPGGTASEVLNIDGCYADYAEQNRVAEELLNFNFACNSLGLVWWQFHDVNWVTKTKGGIAEWEDYLGIVSMHGTTTVTGLINASPPSMEVTGQIKEIGDSTGAFKNFENSTETCSLTDADFRNPNNINNDCLFYGYVRNNGNPIEGAVVSVYKRVPDFHTAPGSYRNVMFTSTTDSNGRYEVPTVFSSTGAYMIKASHYGMTVDDIWFGYDIPLDPNDDEYNGNDFVLNTITYPTAPIMMNDITISTNTTWDTGEDRWLAGNVTVASGATLTIKCEVYFLEGKGITVNTGGKLTLNGGKLSSAGNDYLWNGITLMGNTSLNQSLANQGYFSMNYGAVIANANIAVKVYGGGICKIYDGSFINNKCSLYFYAYTNPSIPTFNESSISGADFYITGPLNNAQTPLYFAYLSSVKDIEFYNCTFTNSSDNSIRANYRSKGIHAASSTPDVSSTTFNGLYYGVYCSGGTPKIYNSTFENNFRGIYTGNSTNVDINNNTFDGAYTFLGVKGEYIPNPPPYIYEPYSVYIAGDGVNNTVYKFEDNVIENGKIGSLFYNTGPNAVQAKRNSYSNITGATNACAAVTIGKNSDFVYNSGTQFGEQGLEFRCNTFNSNAYSLSIIDGNMRKYQGEQGASQGSDYAGNAFNHVGTNIHRDFYVDTVVVSSLNIGQYTYYSHSDTAHMIVKFTNSKVNEAGKAYSFDSIHCATSGGGGGIILGMSVSQGTEIVEQTDTEIMLKEFELEEVTDDGNTYLLLSQAETMNSNNSVAVAEEISDLDGYISDEVAITYMQNVNGNQFAKANALLENSPLPLSVRDEIDNMDMNPTLKHIVKTQQNGVNNRDKKQSEIAELKQHRGLVINEMVYSAIYNDSLLVEIQELEQFLLSDNNLQSKMHLVNLYRSKNDKTNAHATLNEIKLMLKDMDNENLSEIEDYIDLQNIIIDVESQSLSIEDAIESNSELLTYIAQTESHLGQVSAQLLLAEAGVEEYFELIRLPEPLISEKSVKINDYRVTQMIDYKDIINVYPNPTNGAIYVEYAFLTIDAGKFIEIYGINGVLIDRIDLIQSAGLFSYNKLLSPGNYIIKVGENYTQQITVQ